MTGEKVNSLKQREIAIGISCKFSTFTEGILPNEKCRVVETATGTAARL
ncbi:MAG: hypothetical protein ACLS8D_17355 [Clostridioides difficile]|jgi:hypothetical protein